MTRLAGPILLLAALPTDASDPIQARMEKPRPTQSAEPPLALPIPNPRPTTGGFVDSRLLETLLCPNRALTKWAVPCLNFDANDPNVRMRWLLTESEDLRAAREEFHKFWMNSQPSVLTYQRLKGAIVP